MKTLNVVSMVLVSLMTAAAAFAQPETLEQRANNAFHEGQHAKALELYEALLEDDPDNLTALFRSGVILSWDKRFDEAIVRLERILKLDPGNIEARKQRARILSWTKRLDEAEREFARILESDPSDLEARLGHARTLSWSGQQSAARGEYQQVLRISDRDPSATVGIAQTWAWSGHPRKAQVWYEKALALDPEMLAARLGIAHLAISEGDLMEASQIATALQQDFPEDPDVAALMETLDDVMSPWYAGSFERVEDTENNELDIARVEAGWALPSRMRMTFGFTRFDMTSPSGEGTIDSPSLTAVWTPRFEDRLTFRVGADFREKSDGSKDAEPIGGIAWQHMLPGRWQTLITLDHDSFRYSVPILDSQITTTNLGARFQGSPADWLRTTLGVGGADYSDNNEQLNGDIGLWFRLPIQSFSLEVGYVGRYLDFDQNLDNGYFDPSDFRSHIAQLVGRGSLGESNGYWAVTFESGIQSFELGPVIVDDDELFGWYATLGLPIGKHLSLELNGGKSDYALQSATGFESEQYSVRLRVQP